MRPFLLAACLSAAIAAGAAAQTVDDQRLRGAGRPDGNWVTFGRDYTGQRFSPLDAINRSNVRNMVPVWMYQTGVIGSTQTHPVVVDGVMYATMPGNDVAAIAAATGEPLWRYTHKFANELPRAASNRGAAVAYGKVYEATDDGRIIALDQATGKLVWDTTVKEFDASSLVRPGQKKPDTVPFVMRAAPVVYDGRIIVGATGFEQNIDDAALGAGGDVAGRWIEGNLGRRAFLAAFDAATGKEVWRWYTTKDDGWEGDFAEVAGDGTRLNRDVKTERALAARYKNAWAAGSGATWMTPSVDPALGLLFFGTGNPAPGNMDWARPGDNLYTNGIAALEASSGRLRWFFQWTPHDITSSDATTQTVLFDATVDGRSIPALAGCGKLGWCFVLERSTGRFLFKSDAVVPQMNMYAALTPEGTLVPPGGTGGVGVSPLSYDAGQGLLFVGGIHRPTLYKMLALPADGEVPAQRYTKSQPVPASEAWGTLTALDLRNRGKIAWQVKLPQPQVGGTLATAGGLVFTGEANGRFGAYDSATGALLWSFQTGANVGAPPMSYAIGGRQFVAVATGAAAQPPGLRPGGAIVVFALPQ